MIGEKELNDRFKNLGQWLAGDINPSGYWEGKLSSSALGVAVAVAALHFDNPEAHAGHIAKGLRWLEEHINSDGSFGDTPESPGNVSTSLLVYAAASLYAAEMSWVNVFRERVSGYLGSQGVDTCSSQVAQAVLAHYRKDYTFSVPILTMCGLCGVPGDDAFDHIPQLPFELALLPRRMYRLLNLSVVSYAIPALVAVGIVIFKRKKSGLLWKIIRKYSVKRALVLLHRMMPESGGFLEAIPLTAFVCLSLNRAGYGASEVVTRGIRFLTGTQREDGGWPIDVDLSTWVTTLSVKAYRSQIHRFLTQEQQERITDHLLTIQNKTVHPFNGTAPGGWGWTHFPGSVPDGDDTPGAILALLALNPKEKIKSEILMGTRWLCHLQNSDGGFPTFSRGWGKLPFDQSCADLTGHGLLAISAVMEAYGNDPAFRERRRLTNSFFRALKYLETRQADDGSWLPLWFGNQQTAGHANPVYGTARVLTYLADSLLHRWHDHTTRMRLTTMTDRAAAYLLSVQNDDGSWGGGENVEGTMEETALAVSAIVAAGHHKAAAYGLEWLEQCYRKSGFNPAPIGLYFASLWYNEKLYPVTSWLEALARYNAIV